MSASENRLFVLCMPRGSEEDPKMILERREDPEEMQELKILKVFLQRIA